MKVLFLVNRVEEIEPKQTTAMFIRSSSQRVETCVTDVRSLGVDTRIKAMVRRAEPEADVSAMLQRLSGASASSAELESFDLIVIRTNPARDDAGLHDLALQLCSRVENLGTRVVNAPAGLRLFGTKLGLTMLPTETLPATLVSAAADDIRAFVHAHGHVVLKPASGTRGRDVFQIHAGDPNLDQLISIVSQDGMAVAQEFVPAAKDGDTRVVVCGGAPLVLEGHNLAIHRVPKAGDFRSNLHAGGSAHPGEVSATMFARATMVAEVLLEHGVWIAGLDFIGDVICEVNVFSTGGFRDAERFGGVDFSGHVVDRLISGGDDV